MTVDIVPLTASDASSLTLVGLTAFADDPLNAALERFNELDPVQRTEHLQWRTERNLRRMMGPGKHWFKAVDSVTANLIGYVGMLAPKKARPETASSTENHTAAVPANVDVGLLALFENRMMDLEERHMGGKDDYWFVSSMAVHPDHQGRGIAKRLLLKGLELADEAGQDVYLESTPLGKRLYEGVGFEVLEEFTVKDVFPMTVMLRKAKPKDEAC